MTSVLSALLLLILPGEAPAASRYPQALELYRCAFDTPIDKDYDLWPDRWSRQGGPGYPRYVQMAIHAENGAPCARTLRIELNGGAAIAYSPPIVCNSLVSCVLEGELRTDGLEHDQAFLSLTFLGVDRQPLSTHTSERVRHTPQWRKLRVGPIAPGDPRVAYAVVGLHLEPSSAESRQDIHGTASFTDLWLGCLPQLKLSTNSPHNLFTAEQAAEVTCDVSGFEEPNPAVELTLEDASGKSLSRETHALEVVPLSATPPGKAAPGATPDTPEQQAQRAKLDRRRHQGKLTWKPKLPDLGFYRVQVGFKGSDAGLARQSLSLAVLAPRTASLESEFGWELPHGGPSGDIKALGALLMQAGIHWVKYPVWLGAQTSDEKYAALQSFCERLAIRNVEVVGLLCDPPAEIRSQVADLKDPSTADIFALPPAQWYPSLEPTLARLSGQIRWWQLGADRDTSFVGYPQLLPQIETIRSALGRLGSDVNVGFGWNWLYQLPGGDANRLPFRFLALTAQPPLTAEELGAYLQATRQARAQRWVTLEPLARTAQPSLVRIQDLAERMIAAKLHEAEGIVASDPFDAEHGLLEPDGSPGALFLPWRTVALMLGGGQYHGRLELSRDARCEVFSRAGEALVAVWADRPHVDTLYLGEDLQQVDLWGRGTPLRTTPKGQEIRIERWPSFVTGVNRSVVRWCIDCALTETRLPGTVGKTHATALRIKNHFATVVAGKADVILPAGWLVEPRQINFHLERDEAVEIPLRLTLPLDANTGRHPVRIDFDFPADRPYRFSVFRHVNVGVGDVSIEVRTHLNSNGLLEVEQCFLNDTRGRVTFRCELFAPDRRRQRWDVVDLQPGRDVHVYYLPDGKELIGRPLSLRAEELSGSRILNYRFTAEK